MGPYLVHAQMGLYLVLAQMGPYLVLAQMGPYLVLALRVREDLKKWYQVFLSNNTFDYIVSNN